MIYLQRRPPDPQADFILPKAAVAASQIIGLFPARMYTEVYCRTTNVKVYLPFGRTLVPFSDHIGAHVLNATMLNTRSSTMNLIHPQCAHELLWHFDALGQVLERGRLNPVSMGGASTERIAGIIRDWWLYEKVLNEDDRNLLRVYARSTQDVVFASPLKMLKADLWEAFNVKRYTVVALPGTKEIHITLRDDRPWEHLIRSSK